MRVYLAGDYTDKELIRGYHTYFEMAKLEVVSSWYEVDQKEPEILKATRDLAQVVCADAIVVFLNIPNERHGKFLEWGYALALNKIIVVVGELEYDMAFLHNANVARVSNHREAVEYLKCMEVIGK